MDIPQLQEMAHTQDYGLPKLVCDLLKDQQSKTGQSMDFKISSSGKGTKLILTWTPCSINRQYSTQVNGVSVPPKGYRRKSPSELARDQRRKEVFVTRKRQNNGVISKVGVVANDNALLDYDKSHVVLPKQACNAENGPSGVTTRQQAKLRNRMDSMEQPRDSVNDLLAIASDISISPVPSIQTGHSQSQLSNHSTACSPHVDHIFDPAGSDLSQLQVTGEINNNVSIATSSTPNPVLHNVSDSDNSATSTKQCALNVTPEKSIADLKLMFEQFKDHMFGKMDKLKLNLSLNESNSHD